MQHLPRLGLGAILFLLAAWVLACSSKSAPPRRSLLIIHKDFPVQETWNARITYTDSGRMKATIYAPHVSQYARGGPNTEKHLDGGVEVHFYNSAGQHTSSLNALRGIIYPNNDIEVFGRVVMVTDDCTTVRTEYAKWTSNDQKIRSDKFVTIQRPNETLSGYGFESDQHLRNYRIFNATAVMKVRQELEE
ncbi:MAG: LPS export ABC transporter periplasmic protein LptC [Candidatus Thermochlorobacter aerophilum]|jgi:LPS export ABC transporter protein LptC|uniref:LPS export ABC transporter periplasmic protein LptC n=1 Tax=Candidatus Thermochlorobacter aerophilus TaxID=1868324 RepID=A0A395LZQ8_9BACT|nr:MAG: LPS export ABC transporter periplasmic protein LptC [Candidatus Thermochlorobacter aerophilum]